MSPRATIAAETGLEAADPALPNTTNPFFLDWETPFAVPPFDLIEDAHYKEAFDHGVEQMHARVAAIVESPAPPTFDNTIKDLELISPILDRMMRTLRNFTATDTNDVLQELRSEIFPRIARENDAILHDEKLFRRIREVYERRDELGLDVQDSRLLELTHSDFVRAGAALESDAKARLTELNSRLAELGTQFTRNLLAETKQFELVVDDEAGVAGLPADLVRAARNAAEEKGKKGAWAFSLDRTSFEAFMSHAENRELRRRLFDAYRLRGAHGTATDSRQLLLEMVRLRAERAELLGYASHAHYVLDDTMTKTPERALELLTKVWEPGLERAREELAEMQAIVDDEGGGFQLEGWDWWYYAEKLRQRKYNFDESQVKPYFELGNVHRGAFYVAGRLFGLVFEPLDDVPVWHPLVKAYEVRDREGSHVGIFMIDDYVRDSKKDGAWMDNYREATAIDGEEVRPIVVNVMNLIEPAEGEPALMSFEEVETLFHEFGHALHGLVTRARYERFSGAGGSPRDFVEFPSQFMEHYASDPEVLAHYARHHETGETIAPELIEKLRGARLHNQGFKTVEYVVASFLDLAWHTLSCEEAAKLTDYRAFEKQVLERYGLIDQIEPRYRSPYFAHIFSSPIGYSAGYYAYLWSEVLDADGFAAFEATGDVFDPELAGRLAEHVYGAGYVAPGDVLYRRFRGRDPEVEALLRQRGFSSLL